MKALTTHQQRKRIVATISKMSNTALEAAVETLWPTRCAICDRPDILLCNSCRLHLPFIDAQQACSRCGAPFGRVQCSECNPVTLQTLACNEVPFSSATSSVVYEEGARRLITTYKDQGEQRLATVIANLMSLSLNPTHATHANAVTFIPASLKAQRHRGFDHAELLARKIADDFSLPCFSMFYRPHSVDQRTLTRQERITNMSKRLNVLPGATIPRSLLLIDDVYTTGATLFAACNALQEAGVRDIHCLTFARVW